MYMHSALYNEETSRVLVWLVGLFFNKLVIFHDRLGGLEIMIMIPSTGGYAEKALTQRREKARKLHNTSVGETF